MAVIINEFEVVVGDSGQQSGTASGGGAAAQPAAPQPLRPLDIVDVLRHQTDRLARLRAE